MSETREIMVDILAYIGDEQKGEVTRLLYFLYHKGVEHGRQCLHVPIEWGRLMDEYACEENPPAAWS